MNRLLTLTLRRRVDGVGIAGFIRVVVPAIPRVGEFIDVDFELHAVERVSWEITDKMMHATCYLG